MPANAEKNSIIKKISGFIKKEAVLCAAAILAVISMFFVQPDKAYAGYIDYRVISLLFCLMLVVAGLQSVGLFRSLGSMLLRRAGGTRQLIFILVFLCFFCSMFITADKPAATAEARTPRSAALSADLSCVKSTVGKATTRKAISA